MNGFFLVFELDDIKLESLLLKKHLSQRILIIPIIIQSMNFKYKNLSQVCILLVLVALTTCQECSASDKEFFVTFHPHLDAFWLNTDDQLKSINFTPQNFLYEMNQRNSKTIFSSMYDALSGQPSRKYFVTEVVFFKDWYDQLNQIMKLKVKFFISTGQLQIVNGGWVQNDEAVCYIDDIIDQYTVGHNFLRQTFHLQMKIAWATDSFGHSHSQVAIEHLLGFQTQGIERIDDRYIYQRKNGSLLQFYWSAVSDSNGRKYGGVYTHIRHFLHQFVNYRILAVNLMSDYQQITKTMSQLYKKNKYFRFVGNDFEQFIPQEFQILQKTMSTLNDNQKQNCPMYKYGNPSDYFATISSQQSSVPVRQSDFMPNYDQDHYWSGYFTTNPMLKVICKDFSRLVNLFRKILLNERVTNGKEIEEQRNLLRSSDQLLSVMQHHDGITATSKYDIQELFKQRMTKNQEQIIKAIESLKKTPSNRCLLDFNQKKCSLQAFGDSNEIYLTILHQGAKKQEKFEIDLPNGKYFQAEIDKKDSIFCNQNKACTLVFQGLLKPGKNIFKLNRINNDNQMIFKTAQFSGPKYAGDGFTVEISGSTAIYSLENGDFISFSLQRAASIEDQVSTKTWNKFGQAIKKQEKRQPGIYIMANNGKLESYPASKFTSLRVTQGNQLIKCYLLYQDGQITVTIDKSQLNILELQTVFQPSSLMVVDYFLRIASKIKSDGVFYHDMNGYLVSKRKIGERLDYQWDYRPEDKINANTYPMCSFGYITDGDQKLVVFTDRAQGFTTFDEDILINIDRLGYDDYKGAGEGYMKQIQNTFKHKIALVSHTQFIQRLWQRKYDELTLGFVSKIGSLSKPKNFKEEEDQDQTFKWVKYTTFSLNKNQFLLRLFNMNENEEVTIPKYTTKKWKLPQLGLNLTYVDIAQTFANGNPMSARKRWTQIEEEINVSNLGAKDSAKKLIIEPLQIRTFRINLVEKLPWKTQRIEIVQQPSESQKPQKTSNNVKSNNYLAGLTLIDPKPMKKHLLKSIF